MGGRGGSYSVFDRVAFVTGGGGGLGRGFCRALAGAGADVAVLDLDGGAALETAAGVQALGRVGLGLAGDVGDPDDVARAVDAALARFGRLDILVCNAGISPRPARVADASLEDWDRVMAVDVRGVFLSARACLPHMVAQGSGSIVTIASVLGVRPLPTPGGEAPNFPYGVAKAAVIRLTKEIAADYARDGVRANCIAPGWHRGTGLSARWAGGAEPAAAREAYEHGIVQMTPMGRRGEPEELHGLLLYLASDASSFMTGQVLVSDGGVCL